MVWVRIVCEERYFRRSEENSIDLGGVAIPDCSRGERVVDSFRRERGL